MKYLVFICLSSFYFNFPVEELGINGSLNITPAENNSGTDQTTTSLIPALFYTLITKPAA
jgi:hypothetical protein